MKRLTQTKLFIDGGDPKETAEASRLLNEAGYAGLDGQTTNPSLVAKNPEIAAQIQSGKKLSQNELLAKYKQIVQDIEKNAPGAISIEVYSDHDSTASEMVEQGRLMTAWISSAVIKLPITPAGLQAAELLKSEVHLNMTLCFSQAQAAAVYAATRGSRWPVFVSPFIGRLYDRGENGMDVIANLMKMFAKSDQHVQVLTASVRSLEHVQAALALGTHAITLPFEKAFLPWANASFSLPAKNYVFPTKGEPIAYQELDLAAEWQTFDSQHELTDTGLKKFADDWNALLK